MILRPVVHVWPQNLRLTVPAAGATVYSSHLLFVPDEKLGLLQGLPCGPEFVRPALERASTGDFDSHPVLWLEAS